MNIIKIISAMSKDKVIGFNNKIPWKIPEEMKHFKDTTMGNIVIMGHVTYYSVGELYNRLNIVLTRNEDLCKNNKEDGPIFLNSVDACLDYISTEVYEAFRDSDVYVIGGEQIYRLFEPHASEIILSEIPTEIEGDAYFPINVHDETEWELHFVEYREKYILRKYIKTL